MSDSPRGATASTLPSQGAGVVGGQPAPDATEAGVVASAVAPAAGGAISFVDNGGPIIATPHLHLIFWGTAWTGTTTPTVGGITDAVLTILAGPYMSALDQYRVHSGRLDGAVLMTTQIGIVGANPPNPFSDGDVQNLITCLIDTGRVPGPAVDGQLLYCVFMPQNVASSGTFIGEHTFFSYHGTNARYAWVTNSGTLAAVTSIFSHELVEACTDPEGSAWLGTAGTCSQPGWCEIADVCSTTAILNGVTVQSYWSNRDGGCIVPNAKYQKDNKDSKETKDKENKEHKEHKDAKDRKDHKELKEGAKEKEKDGAKEKDLDDVGQLASVVGQLSVRVDDLTQRLDQLQPGGAHGGGTAFIRPQERPPVGEQALNEPPPEGEA